jgi:hypothetical protein
MLHHVSLELPAAQADRFAQKLSVLWYEREHTQIHLILTDGATVPLLGHAALVADDFDADVAALCDAGFSVEDARELWGEPRTFLLAPGGHRIELMAAPP